jgi:dGTP triphosphohydrolase
MDEFNVEVSSLKHNFWQILNLSKQLLARNEVLKAKLKEQEKCFEWKLTEMQKSIDDLKRKNNLLQKRLANDEDGVSVVSKDYEDVVKGSLSQVSPRESYDAYKNSEQNTKGRENRSNEVDEEEQDEEEDEENSQESDKNSVNSV